MFSFVKFSYNITINSDNTGSESAIFSFDGESDTENESFTWENKGLDFKATSQTYNFTYTSEEDGDTVVNVAIFSNNFKTMRFEDFEDGVNPFTKQ